MWKPEPGSPSDHQSNHCFYPGTTLIAFTVRSPLTKPNQKNPKKPLQFLFHGYAISHLHSLKSISVLHNPLKFNLNLDFSMCQEYIHTKQYPSESAGSDSSHSLL